MTLAELSLKRPVTAIMFFVSMTVIGLLAAFRLPLEYMPDIEAPFLFINVPYPGSTPAEIERTCIVLQQVLAQAITGAAAETPALAPEAMA